jgi:hypothetical protein
MVEVVKVLLDTKGGKGSAKVSIFKPKQASLNLQIRLL